MVEMMVEMMDEDVLQHMDALSIPRAPRTEEEIQEDSFEGFLRMQFNGLLPSEPSSNREYRVINFETFLVWRKRMGVLLTRKEIESIFVSVTNNEYCTETLVTHKNSFKNVINSRYPKLD